MGSRRSRLCWPCAGPADICRATMSDPLLKPSGGLTSTRAMATRLLLPAGELVGAIRTMRSVRLTISRAHTAHRRRGTTIRPANKSAAARRPERPSRAAGRSSKDWNTKTIRSFRTRDRAWPPPCSRQVGWWWAHVSLPTCLERGGGRAQAGVRNDRIGFSGALRAPDGRSGCELPLIYSPGRTCPCRSTPRRSWKSVGLATSSWPDQLSGGQKQARGHRPRAGQQDRRLEQRMAHCVARQISAGRGMAEAASVAAP